MSPLAKFPEQCASAVPVLGTLALSAKSATGIFCMSERGIFPELKNVTLSFHD
jgi:hypothetical protein